MYLQQSALKRAISSMTINISIIFWSMSNSINFDKLSHKLLNCNPSTHKVGLTKELDSGVCLISRLWIMLNIHFCKNGSVLSFINKSPGKYINKFYFFLVFPFVVIKLQSNLLTSLVKL